MDGKKKKVAEFGDISSGGTPNTSKGDYWGGEIDWITPTDITKKDSVYIQSSARNISHEGLKNSSAKLLPKGSLLVCTRASIGGMAITSHEMCTNQGFKNIVPNDNTDIVFIYYLLTYFKHKLISKASGSTFLELSKSAFESMKFHVPVLEEQQKIAEILAIWDKAINTTERLIDNSKQQKKSLMQQLLTGTHTGKRLLDDSGKPFEGEWEEIVVGDLGTIYSGGTPSTSNKAYWDGDIDWVTPTDITKQNSVYINSSVRKISSLGLKNSSAKLIPKGSLLVCTRATIGEMAITAHEMSTNQGFKNIIPNNGTNIEFVFYLLTYEKHKLVSKASGSTFLELSKSAFESMKFNVPLIGEQEKIASVLTNADKEIELLERQLADLKQEKKALMQQLLTGKRRVMVN